MNQDEANAALNVCNLWQRLRYVDKTPVDVAYTMTALNDAIHDLSTWVPGYSLDGESDES